MGRLKTHLFKPRYSKVSVLEGKTDNEIIQRELLELTAGYIRQESGKTVVLPVEKFKRDNDADYQSISSQGTSEGQI